MKDKEKLIVPLPKPTEAPKPMSYVMEVAPAKIVFKTPQTKH